MRALSVFRVDYESSGVFLFDFLSSECYPRKQRWSIRMPGLENIEDNEPMENWPQQLQYFEEWLAILRRETSPVTSDAASLDVREARASSVNGETTVLVFISHSHADESIAEAMADLIRQALKLDPKQIRCTSVKDYALPYGRDVADRLRVDIASAEVLIGIVSPSGVESSWVLFELGARWGQGAYLIPALAGGAEPCLIPPPIKNLSALSCDNDHEIIKMIEELAAHLGLENPPVSGHKRLVDELVQRSKAVVMHVEEKKQTVSEIVFAENAYWRRNPEGKLDGPFCSTCYDDSNKLIRLTFEAEGTFVGRGKARRYTCALHKTTIFFRLEIFNQTVIT